jgi:hypothetical protein
MRDNTSSGILDMIVQHPVQLEEVASFLLALREEVW